MLGAGWCFVAVKLYYSQKPRLCSDPPPTYNSNNNNNSTPQHGARKTVHSTRAAYQAYVPTVLCNVTAARDRYVTSVSWPWQWISAVSLSPQSSVCTVSAPDRQLQRAVLEIFPNTVIFPLHREHGMSLTITGRVVGDCAGSQEALAKVFFKTECSIYRKQAPVGQ